MCVGWLEGHADIPSSIYSVHIVIGSCIHSLFLLPWKCGVVLGRVTLPIAVSGGKWESTGNRTKTDSSLNNVIFSRLSTNLHSLLWSIWQDIRARKYKFYNDLLLQTNALVFYCTPNACLWITKIKFLFYLCAPYLYNNIPDPYLTIYELFYILYELIIGY